MSRRQRAFDCYSADADSLMICIHRKFHRTHCSDAKGRSCCEAHGGTAVDESRRAIGLRKGERNQAEEIEYLAAFGNALGFSTIEKLHGVSTVDKVYKTINGDAQVLRFL